MALGPLEVGLVSSHGSLTRCLREDRIHGQGVAVFASGNRYEGTWENGRIHGHGAPRVNPNKPAPLELQRFAAE